MSLSSSSSFTMRARSTSAGAFLNRKPEGSRSASRFLSATVMCFGLNPNGPSLGFLAAASNPLPKRIHHSLARNDNFSALNFVPRLRVISHVSKEDAASFRHQQETSAPGKPAKISNVGKMADQPSIQPSGSKLLPQSLLPRKKVHRR